MTEGSRESTSAAVSAASNKLAATKQAEEGQGRRPWTEPMVWTPRMLAALERGVKGGKWFSLVDKVYAPQSLFAAFQKVAGNKGAAGVDHQTIEMYEDHLIDNLKELSRSLKEEDFHPHALRRTWIPKPGGKEQRPLGIPTVRDRVVQTALRNVLEPIFEKDFHPRSFGFRPGRGCPQALDQVQRLLEEGYRCVVDADFRSYFDTIPHQPLVERLKEKVSDGRVLGLVEQFLKQGVLEGLVEWTPEAGAPQGAVISPLLSNIYLDPLDHLMAEAGFEMVRYADDLVIMCRTPEDAQRALVLLQEWTAKAGLSLHPTKTRVVDAVTDGFEFLGYRFVAGTCVPRDKSIAKLKDSIRRRTRRTNGNSLDRIIATLNPVLRGWHQYFRRSNSTPFDKLDGWIRMRLRSILRKRRGGSGAGRGLEHKRYPNDYFTRLGLFSLLEAHHRTRRSAQAVNH